MGWYQYLDLTCVVHPDYVEFYKKDCLCTYNGENPKSYRDLVDIWTSLDIGNFFKKYDISGSTLVLSLGKKVTRHEGSLWEDYKAFLDDIIVPTTTEIISCKLWDDEYECYESVYTDMELRGQHLHLPQLVKSFHHTWIDGRIAETHIVYKRGIPAIQQIDLERLLRS